MMVKIVATIIAKVSDDFGAQLLKDKELAADHLTIALTSSDDVEIRVDRVLNVHPQTKIVDWSK